MKILLTIACSLTLLVSQIATALNPEPDAIFVRIIDTGAGHAAVVQMPGNHFMVYDTGHWNQDNLVRDRIQEIVPQGQNIDLLVLSHSDSDHLAATDELFDLYAIDRVLRGGLQRSTGTWTDSNNAIVAADGAGTTIDVNLETSQIEPGATYRFGSTWITMVSGEYWPPTSWGLQNNSERRNAGSVVIRLNFAGRSILFTGDAVGRHLGDPPEALLGSERIMVENAHVIPINSDILIAPHHGADNGSSSSFIHEVSPEWVIFPAGHAHRHPRAVTAQRYLAHGVSLNNIFRTDLGDDEGDGEWAHGRIIGNTDPAGDDDVDILIRPNGEVVVEYRTP
jgi:beta-lactamase superfamily II metal-dependent hydrolase